MAVAKNGVPSSPLRFTDTNASSRLFVGTNTPSNPSDGDVWMNASPLNNAGKNLMSQVTLSGGTVNLAVNPSYKDVCIVIQGLTASAAANLTITLNSDGGTGSSDYAGAIIGGSTITSALFQVPLSSGVTTNGLIITLQDTQDTTSWQMGRLEGNNGTAIMAAGLYKSSVAISSVNLVLSTGSMSGTALVYGVN